MKDIRRSLAFSFLEKYGNLAVSVVGVIILARLLTPAETGLYAVASSIVHIGQALREFGIGIYIIQEKNLTREKVASALGICLCLAGILAAVLFSLSGPMAAFYGHPDLVTVITVLCPNLFIVAFSSISAAQLRREMRFREIMIINLLSSVVGTTVSICLAALGLGALGLAWGALATACVAVIGNYRALGWDRLTGPSLRHWRGLLRFGLFASANGLLGVLVERAPDLVVGRLVSLTGAGLYSRGNGLITLFRAALINAVNPVATASLAALHRRDVDVRAPLLRVFSFLSAVGWPALGVLGVLAYPIIIIMFGGQWIASVPVAKILCIGAAFTLMGSICQTYLNATGAVQWTFVVQSLAVPVFVAFVALGALHSLVGAAIGAAAAFCVQAVLALVVLARRVPLTGRDIARAVAPSLVVTAITVAPPVAVSLTLGVTGPHPLGPALLAGAGAAVAWLAALYIVRHPLRHEVASVIAWGWRAITRVARRRGRRDQAAGGEHGPTVADLVTRDTVAGSPPPGSGTK